MLPKFVPDLIKIVKVILSNGFLSCSGQEYLQDLIDADLAENGGKLGIATEGLLWLKR